VTVQTPFEGAKEAAYLTTVGADPLVSQFTPSYGMVLNLLQTHTLEEAQELVERSFGQYLSTLYLRPQQEAIAHLEAELAQLRSQLEAVDWDLLAQYEKLQERMKEERRLLKILQDQANELRAGDLPVALSFAIAGTVLSLKGSNVPVAQPTASRTRDENSWFWSVSLPDLPGAEQPLVCCHRWRYCGATGRNSSTERCRSFGSTARAALKARTDEVRERGNSRHCPPNSSSTIPDGRRARSV
jgi:superfamily II RNA helicase